MVSRFYRRKILAGVAAIALFRSLPVFAIGKSAAESYVAVALRDLESLVNSGKARSGLIKDVSAFFHKYANVPSLARTVLGSPWRGMSDAQKREYIAAFEGYVVRKYTNTFSFLKGGKAEIVRVASAGGGSVLVDAVFNRPKRAAAKAIFQVSEVGGQTKVIDLKIEGISLVGTERILIRKMLANNGNNIDKMIAELRLRPY